MYNRYSYVRNNPLNATDPSGYFVFSLTAIALTATKTVTGFWAVVGAFAAAGFGDAMIQGASVKQALKAGLISGVSAAAFYGIGEYFSGLEGANQAAALKRNLQFLDRTSAYMQASKVGLTTAQSLGKIAAHGFAGGVMSVLGGGKFGHGFAAAGLTQAAGGQIGRIGGGSTATGPTLARIAAASVLGGSVSKLTGGKFANGAITGAFSRAVNHEAHITQKSKVNFIYETDGLDKFKAAAEQYAEHYEGILPPGEHDVHVYIENFKSGDHMMQARNGVTIWVAPDYADHPLNIVGTAIGHELVHLRDYLDPNMNMSRSFNRNSSELNAYQWNLDHAKEFNLPLRYKSYFRQKKQQYY